MRRISYALKVLDWIISGKTHFNIDVIDHLKELDNLELWQCGGTLTLGTCSSLGKLKRLNIDSGSTDDAEFLLKSSAAESLEYLELRQPILNNDFFIELSRFKNLSALLLIDRPEPANEEIMLSLDLSELTEFILRGTSGANDSSGEPGSYQ